MTHPLAAHEKWIYWQPYIRLETQCVVIPKDRESGNPKARILSSENTCRESTIYNLRAIFTNIVFNLRQESSWKKRLEEDKEIFLDHELIRGRPTTLLMRDNGLFKRTGEDPYVWEPSSKLTPKDIQVFVGVADRICGTAAVLLAPHRVKGDWWKTNPKTCYNTTSSFVSWHGTDNFLLYHPALTSIATGLFRQCALLCSAGFGDQIIAAIPQEKIDYMLTKPSWRTALEVANEIRPWIEVPLPAGAFEYNIPFPIGYWRRFIRLQRALRRHGYEKVFGQTFLEGWALGRGQQRWTGAYSFWGQKGEESAFHRRLMRLGEPRRRARKQGRKNGKSAPRVP